MFDNKDEVLILNGVLVKCSIVDAHAQKLILLLLKQVWGPKRGFKRVNIA